MSSPCPPSSPRLRSVGEFGDDIHGFLQHAEQYRRYTEIKEEMDSILRGDVNTKTPEYEPPLEPKPKLKPVPDQTKTPEVDSRVVQRVVWIMPELEFGSLEQDTVFQCSDGEVSAPSLLLVLLAPWMAEVLQEGSGQEGSIRNILCPDLKAENLAGFIKDILAKKNEITVPEVIKKLILTGLTLDIKKTKPFLETKYKKENFNNIERTKESKTNWLDKNNSHLEKLCNCNLTFSSALQKNEHLKVTHDIYEKCHTCKKIYLDLKGEVHVCKVNKQTVQKKSRPPKCVVCEKRTHKEDFHSTIPSSPCQECGKILRNAYMLKRHGYTAHTPNLPCTVCGKVVKHIRLHMRISHTDSSEKKYKCEQCGKGFGGKSAYKQHTSIHQNLRPHKCRKGCDLGFNDSGNRAQHEKRVHRGGDPTNIGNQ